MLERNATWLMLDLNFKNAHTLCFQNTLEGKLELIETYLYMLMSVRALYGKAFTV
jgi:hypothetical protein